MKDRQCNGLIIVKFESNSAVLFYIHFQRTIRRLHVAIENGNLHEIKQHMINRLAVCRDKGGRGLLHKAVLYERRFIIKYFLKEYPQMVHIRDFVSSLIFTNRLFRHSWLITAFVIRVIRRVPLTEQELPALPEHLSSPPFFVLYLSGVRVVQCCQITWLHVFSSVL